MAVDLTLPISEVSTDDFKPTELGDLPAEWQVVQLGGFVDKNIVRIKNGFPYGGFNEDGKGIPHLRPFNINNNASIDLSSIKYIDTDRNLEPYFLQIGDVFFNNTNSEELVGKTTFWDRPGKFVYSNHMTSLRILNHEIVDPYFLMSYFHKRWREGYFQSLCRRHVNQASISLARIKQIPIPLPPLDEQRRIAHVLNRVQQAIAAQEDVIAAAKELKRSLLRRLFTYGPGPEPAPTKETEIGEVPAHWGIVKIEDVTAERTERNRDLAIQLDRGDVLSVSNMIGFFPSDRLLGEDFSRYKVVRHKNFAYNPMRLNVGSMAIKTDEKLRLVSPDYVVFECREDILLPEYFHQFRRTWKWWYQIRQSGQGSIRIRYYYWHIAAFDIPLPSLSEQHQIAHILQSADAKIAAEQDRLAALQALFNSLLQALMTGRLRVNGLEFGNG